MAIHRLSLRFVETVKQDGMYADGDKLYLQVRMGGKAKSWIFRYVLDGREHSMGLGPLHVVSLAEAREKARPLRQQLLEGIDPLAARSARRLQQRFDAARQVTFRQCAEGWMKGQEAGWSPENAHNYKRRFEKYVYPHLDHGDMPIQVLDNVADGATHLITDILTPIWEAKPTTAGLVRYQIERTLHYAQWKRYIQNGSAAELEGVQSALAPQKAFQKVKHHRDLPYDQVGKLVVELRAYKSPNKRGLNRLALGDRSYCADMLELLILTAVRRDNVVRAKFEDVREFDGKKLWVIGQHKTKDKTDEDYVVALSHQALAVFERMQQLQAASGIKSRYLFPGRDPDKPMVAHGLNRFVEQSLRRTDFVPHGFRGTFGKWCVDHNHPEVDSEMALNHKIGDATRRAYKEGAQRVNQRSVLMQAWANYCDRTERLPGDVIPFPKAASNGN